VPLSCFFGGVSFGSVLLSIADYLGGGKLTAMLWEPRRKGGDHDANILRI